jgi:hypothetical protein
MVEQQEQAGTALSGRSKSARAGETPRQQLRKAKVATRRQFSAEEKIRIVMEGMRGEEPVSVICRREGNPNVPMSFSQVLMISGSAPSTKARPMRSWCSSQKGASSPSIAW